MYQIMVQPPMQQMTEEELAPLLAAEKDLAASYSGVTFTDALHRRADGMVATVNTATVFDNHDIGPNKLHEYGVLLCQTLRHESFIIIVNGRSSTTLVHGPEGN